LSEPEEETAQKPTSNPNLAECRNSLFAYLGHAIRLSHEKRVQKETATAPNNPWEGCFFKNSLSVLKSKNLDLKQKIDGFMLLSVYFMPILALLSLLVGLPLIFLGSPFVIALWVSVPISLYCFVGNFAPFFEVGVSLYLDGRTRTMIDSSFNIHFFLISTLLKSIFRSAKFENTWERLECLG
jgi:hypothetical protein